MAIYENVFAFLIRDDRGLPSFAPAGFFGHLTASIPDGWDFSLRSGIQFSGRDLWSSPGVAVWGYPELVAGAGNASGHASRLGERDPAALDLFYQYYLAAEASAAEDAEQGCRLASLAQRPGRPERSTPAELNHPIRTRSEPYRGKAKPPPRRS